jgi:hypothetical protein
MLQLERSSYHSGFKNATCSISLVAVVALTNETNVNTCLRAHKLQNNRSRVFSVLHLHCGPGERNQYSDSLQAGWSGDRIPVGVEIFRTRPDLPWGPTRLLHNWYRVFPGGKATGAWP